MTVKVNKTKASIYGSYVTQITDFISPTEVKVNQTFNEFLEKYGNQEPEIVIDPLNNFRNVNIIYKNNDKRDLNTYKIS